MRRKSWSDDLKDVIMHFTERLLFVFLFVWLLACFCFLLFGIFCHLKWDSLFVFIPPLAKNTIPTLKRLRCYACSVGLLDGLSEGSKLEARAFIKVYYGHGNNPPNLKLEQYRGTNLHFSLWNAANATAAMLVKHFETFWNCRSTFCSHGLKVWTSLWHKLCNILKEKLRVGVSCLGFAPAFSPVTAGVPCITPGYQQLL